MPPAGHEENLPLRVVRVATARPGATRLSVAALTFLGCLLVAGILHEPVPRIHDEFSYLLMSDTFAHGRMANPTPPLPEFFDTFHVLMHPTYASKYYPAQGVLLAIGQELTGHPAVGVWLSAALAVAAAMWMLEAWIGPAWALVGGLLMLVQYGVYSYWSQSYWGGMAAAIGGALAFGAVRRLWDEWQWKSGALLALGIVILVNSRPFEGILALAPVTACLAVHLWRKRAWENEGFFPGFVLPVTLVLAGGAFLTCTYNRAVTGSALEAPYLVYERQYEQSPPFNFLSERPRVSYSNAVIQKFYEEQDLKLYRASREPKQIVTLLTGALAGWWQFYCGIWLAVPLVIPGLLRGGGVRYVQAGLIVALPALWQFADSGPVAVHCAIAVLAVAQAAVLWIVFDDLWPRIAIATCVLLLCEALVVRWYFAHYFAPAACLVLYLEVEGLRRMWRWNAPGLSSERRTTQAGGGQALWMRRLAVAVPVLCAASLVWSVASRLRGWNEGVYDPAQMALPLKDWSLQRSLLQKWMEARHSPQLLLVRYSAGHDLNHEWVYNHADLANAQVVWARDRGTEENRRLLEALPGRTVWLLEPDGPEGQLSPYRKQDAAPDEALPATAVQKSGGTKLNW